MPDSGVLGNGLEKILTYLESAPQNLSYDKVWCKSENP